MNMVSDAPLLINAREAAKLLNIGKSLFYRLHSEGRLPNPIHLGSRVLWSKEELQLWINAGTPDRLKWEQVKK